MLVQKVKKSQKMFAANARYENEWEGYELYEPTSGMLVFRVIISLAERLS